MNAQTGKIAVIYKSKYGSTKCYAAWLAEELNADLFSITEFDQAKLEEYSTVLFGSSVHIGKIKGIDFIKNNWAVLSKKKVGVFATTGAAKVEPQQMQVIDASLPAEISQKIKYFPLPGAYDYNKLDFTDKLLMNMGPINTMRFKVWFKGDKNAKKQLEEFCSTQDWTSKELINPIVEYAKSP